jgi:hypothetical protein
MVGTRSRDGLRANHRPGRDSGRVGAQNQLRGCRGVLRKTQNGEVLMIKSFIIQQDGSGLSAYITTCSKTNATQNGTERKSGGITESEPVS